MGTLNALIILSLAIFQSGIAQDCSSKLNGDLLLSEPNTIWRLPSGSAAGRVAYASSPQAISLDYDYSTRTLYWSDLETRQIYALHDDAKQAKVVVPSQKSWLPFSLAVEEVSGKLYVADSFSGTVKVFDLKRSNGEAIVLGTNLTEVKDVEVDAKEGYLFVLDKFQILRTDLDGSNRKALLTEFGNLDEDFKNLPPGLKSAVGPSISQQLDVPVIYKKVLTISDLAVDVRSKRLFWVNYATRSVESFNYDGTDRKVHFQDKKEDDLTESLGSLTLLGNYVYWADDRTQQVFKVNVNGGSHEVILNDVSPLFVKAITCANQQKVNDPCAVNNGQCDHFCLLSRSNENNHKCVCKIGYELAADQRSCESVHDFLLFTQDNFLRGRRLNANGEISADVINPSRFPVGSASNLDFDAQEGFVYYSSLYPKDQLFQVSLSSGEERKLQPDFLAKNVGNFAYDWITKNLYYFTYYYADMTSLSVLNVRDPTYSKIVVSHVPRLVRGIVVHPNKGLVFFMQMTDDESTISRVNTDGSGLKVLVNLGRPEVSGTLAIDYEQNRLYWSVAEQAGAVEFNVKIQHSNLDGGDIQSLPEIKKLRYPDSLAVSSNHLYLSTGNSILRISKSGSEKAVVVSSESTTGLRGLMVYSRSAQSAANAHPCSSTSCEKFCFAVPDSGDGLRAVCGCPYGQKVGTDGRSCVDNRKEEPPFVPCKYTSFKCNKQTEKL